MKALYTAFGAFAAVALLASCGSEDVLETVQTEVPAGKHLVTLTVDKDAQSRVVMDDFTGEMTWEVNDKIYVKYSSDERLHEFVWSGYVSENGDINDTKATFVGVIDDDVFLNQTPMKVYYNANFTEYDLEYVITDFDSYQTQYNFVADDEGVFRFRDNNSRVYLSGSTDCGGTSVDAFNATLALEDFAMVKISAEDIQEIVEEEIDAEEKVTVTVSGQGYSKEYTIIVEDTEKDLIFFVGGLPERAGKRMLTGFSVKIGSSTRTFGSRNGVAIEAGKRYELRVK